MLFHSVAKHAGCNAAAALLTGMGKDGAAGLLAIRQAAGAPSPRTRPAARSLACPRAAQELNAAEQMLSLEKIPAVLVAAVLSGRAAAGLAGEAINRAVNEANTEEQNDMKEEHTEGELDLQR